MPVMMPSDEMQAINIPGPTGFKFSGTRPENLGASDYTLVTAACDISSSVLPFAKDLSNLVGSVVGACQKSPRRDNLLFRLIVFNERIKEVHGFIELNKVNPDDYKNILKPDGWTALFDATYDAVGATLEYARELIKQDYDCNGTVYIITDGWNNRGTATPKMIADQIGKAVGQEEIRELISILIGLHDPNLQWGPDVKQKLEDFQKQAKLTEFIDVGKATDQKLAKLAQWVSESVSSSSQAIKNGTPSQPIPLNF
jgi:uncharacterized protein YegL